MAIQFVDLYERRALDLIFDEVHTVKIKLFANDHVPADSDDISDYTEAGFSGYGEQDLEQPADWAAASTTAGVTSKTCLSTMHFEHDGGATDETIYGWYATSNDGSELWYAERFAAPVDMNFDGAFIDVTPRVTLKDESD